MISENLEFVNSQISEAARKSGRDPESVRLIAVTKKVPAEKIIEAKNAGSILFGENKIQEAVEKIDTLGQDKFRWHFIGHLQKNKVKFLFGRFEMIHSVDSLELAKAIHQGAVKQGTVLPVLVQVNVSGEESKFGVPPEGLEKLLSDASQYQGIRVEGLMTIPPFDPNPETSRKFFAGLREMAEGINRLNIENVVLKELSMGMTNDYHVAIEEGATLVRIGTAIFGKRMN